MELIAVLHAVTVLSSLFRMVAFIDVKIVVADCKEHEMKFKSTKSKNGVTKISLHSVNLKNGNYSKKRARGETTGDTHLDTALNFRWLVQDGDGFATGYVSKHYIPTILHNAVEKRKGDGAES